MAKESVASITKSQPFAIGSPDSPTSLTSPRGPAWRSRTMSPPCRSALGSAATKGEIDAPHTVTVPLSSKHFTYR
ncbi:MAG TPA: hypothetical protein VFY71_13760 [Planctomycetota bacterium]|nr:hypothetical protein [Planctomycetota bacterium]